MTERLADISARITGIRQLGAVVNAMRGIAAARAQRARSQLIVVDSDAATIAVAIGSALAALASARPEGARKSGRPALVRQAEITKELIELAAGETASRSERN
jgi:F-type H+-transporting ATPase subunit gamma